MIDDTEDNNNNNVKQFSLNLVSPSEKPRDEELRECLDKGVEVFNEIVKGDEIQSFFIIVLDQSDLPTFIGAGEALTLKTLGALEMASDELLKGM